MCFAQAAGEAGQGAGMGAGQEAAANETAAKAKPAVATKKETRRRKKTFRVPLTIAGPGFAQPPMSADQLKVCLLPCQTLLLAAMQHCAQQPTSSIHHSCISHTRTERTNSCTQLRNQCNSEPWPPSEVGISIWYAC